MKDHYRLSIRLYDPESDILRHVWGGRGSCSCGQLIGTACVDTELPWNEAPTLAQLLTLIRKRWEGHRKAVSNAVVAEIQRESIEDALENERCGICGSVDHFREDCPRSEGSGENTRRDGVSNNE